MKNIGKCLILVITLSIMMSGVPILAQNTIYTRVLYKGNPVPVGTSQRVKVDSFNPDDWSIQLRRRINRRLITIATLQYPDGFDYELKRFVGDVDGARIYAKTRIIFSNFRYRNGSTVTGLLSDSWDYYIEPTSPPQIGDKTILEAAIDDVVGKMNEIPVLPGKSPSEVDTGKQFFDSYADLEPLNSTAGLGQARTLLSYFDPTVNSGGDFGPPTEEEVTKSIAIIKDALKTVLERAKIGTKPSTPPGPNPPTPNPPAPAEGLSLSITFFLSLGQNIQDEGKAPFVLNISKDSEILQGLKMKAWKIWTN